MAQLQLGEAGQVGARDENLHVLFRVDQLLQLLRDLRVLRRRRVVDDVDGRRRRRGGRGRRRLRGDGLGTQLRDHGVDEPTDARIRQQRPSRREQSLRAPRPDAAPDGVDEQALPIVGGGVGAGADPEDQLLIEIGGERDHAFRERVVDSAEQMDRTARLVDVLRMQPFAE